MSANPYIIEELYHQYHSGVIFHATDTSSGKHVWIHRFFPHGDPSVGLHQSEVTPFLESIHAIRSWHHPPLKQIYDAQIDPIDQIPYIVTDPITADTVASLLAVGPFSMAQGRQLAEQVLELSILIEQQFSGDPSWLDLDTESVEVLEGGMVFHFSINPLRLLDEKRDSGSIKEIISLIEKAMGWSGRVIAGSNLGSLSGWVRRARNQNLSSADALALLRGEYLDLSQAPAKALESNLVSVANQQAAPTITGLSTQPRVPLASLEKRSFMPGIIIGFLIIASIAAYFLIPKDESVVEQETKSPAPTPESAAKEITTVTNAAPVSPSIAEQPKIDLPEQKNEQVASIVDNEPQRQPEPTIVEPAAPVQAAPIPDFSPDQYFAVSKKIQETVTITGTVTKVFNKGEFRYLYFTDGESDICARLNISLRAKYMSLSRVNKDIVGKKVRIKGVVKQDNSLNEYVRHVIVFTKRNEIEILDQK